MSHIAWDEDPTSSSGPSVRIYNNLHSIAHVRTLGEMAKVDTHWMQGKTVPCLKDPDVPNVCPHCRAGIPIRKVGYIAARMLPKDGSTWTTCIWCIPQRNLPDFAERPIGGLLYKVTRNSTTAAKPLKIELEDKPRTEIDPNLDVRKILQDLWQQYITSVSRANKPGKPDDSADSIPTDDTLIIPYPSRNGATHSRMKGGA